MQPRRDRINYYTIVGAVERSGVFTDERNRVPLKDVIDAADGLVGSKQSAIRIIRSGQNGLQLYYAVGEASQQTVQAGDVIVVVPGLDQQFIGKPEARYIPIACLGLTERPVVLPLSLDLRNLTVLLAKLGQSPQNRAHVRILDPLGNPLAENFLPGSVLIFDPVHVNRNALVSVEEFPPAVPLKAPRIEAQTTLETTPPSVQVDGPSFSSTIVIQPLEQPPVPLQKFVTNDEPQTAEEPAPLLPLPLFHGVITVEEPPLSPIQENVAINPISHEVPPQSISDQAWLIPPVAQLAIETMSEQQNTQRPVSSPETRVASTKDDLLDSAPPPPRETSSSRISRPIEKKTVNDHPNERSSRSFSQAQSGSPIQSDGSDQTTPRDSKSNSLLLFVIGTMCLLGFAFTASRWKTKGLVPQGWGLAQSQKLQAQDEQTVAAAEPTQFSLTMALEPSTPLIEEQVILPQRKLHGEPVGQRRIVVHGPVTRLQGPHFQKKTHSERTTESATSREVVSFNPEEFSPSTFLDKQQQHSATTGEKHIVQAPAEQVIPGDRTKHNATEVNVTEFEFDVVEPIPTEAADFTGSPLERALRILAREKRSS